MYWETEYMYVCVSKRREKLHRIGLVCGPASHRVTHIKRGQINSLTREPKLSTIVSLVPLKISRLTPSLAFREKEQKNTFRVPSTRERERESEEEKLMRSRCFWYHRTYTEPKTTTKLQVKQNEGRHALLREKEKKYFSMSVTCEVAQKANHLREYRYLSPLFRCA